MKLLFVIVIALLAAGSTFAQSEDALAAEREFNKVIIAVAKIPVVGPALAKIFLATIKVVSSLIVLFLGSGSTNGDTFAESYDLLVRIPGVGPTLAQLLVASFFVSEFIFIALGGILSPLVAAFLGLPSLLSGIINKVPSLLSGVTVDAGST